MIASAVWRMQSFLLKWPKWKTCVEGDIIRVDMFGRASISTSSSTSIGVVDGEGRCDSGGAD